MSLSSNIARKIKADRLNGIAESVWNEFIRLATEHKPLNLGQGFPDFAAPEFITDALVKATTNENIFLNQYTRGFGHPRLVNVLGELYSSLINRRIDPSDEILITSGAYQALYSTFMALVDKDDEVILIEPFFDCYEPMVRMAGGRPVFVPLRCSKDVSKQTVSSSQWYLDLEELESKINAKTKLLVINTPHNPIGKIFSKSELEKISDICIKHDLIVIMDEVYEWIFYQGSKHFRMVSLPDMWNRTITIGSAGKTFSVTGWKIGWAYGPKHLIRPLQLLHQNCVYTCPTPIQEAIAIGFEQELLRMRNPDSYWAELARSLETKRNRMVDILESIQMYPTVPEGGYFIVADFSNLAHKMDLSSETGTDDYRFVKWMTKNQKIQMIPMSAFYSVQNQHLAKNLVRFCFIKKNETIERASDILSKFVQTLH
ncbi:Kynurenine--oxoglutarate transaminase 3 [Sarcoptes scabiei]|uniref:Kynurenine--oxoglutarate transaminase 3 n=1 Tax=Sarcoptes scabiei TaxID=52283 RepID=A0A834VEH3_SARSC|nr:Kynurenine--oxoglutarate transaminase 3 [Sarcoptes scabiei]